MFQANRVEYRERGEGGGGGGGGERNRKVNGQADAERPKYHESLVLLTMRDGWERKAIGHQSYCLVT